MFKRVVRSWDFKGIQLWSRVTVDMVQYPNKMAIIIPFGKEAVSAIQSLRVELCEETGRIYVGIDGLPAPSESKQTASDCSGPCAAQFQ